MILLIYISYQILALSCTAQTKPIAQIEPLLSAAADNRTILQTQVSPPWVSSSGIRGTSDILWSCLLTLTACVYTAIHLNVPPAHQGKRQFLWRKSKWVAVALFAPEIVLYCALTQFLEARTLVKTLNKLAGEQTKRLASTRPLPETAASRGEDQSAPAGQEHLAPTVQRGQGQEGKSPLPSQSPSLLQPEETNQDIVTPPDSCHDEGHQNSPRLPQDQISVKSKISSGRQGSPSDQDVEKGEDVERYGRFSLKYGFFAVMGGIVTSDVANIRDDVKGPIVLTPKAILQFAHEGVFFDISPEIISDKSKANLLGKGLVCIQVIWFLIQCVARAAARYPLVLIEVHTMVHVVCALLMYVLWWEKPQDISEPTIQDTSKHLDLLAITTMTSPMTSTMAFPVWSSHEVCFVTYYGKERLEHSQSSSASEKGQNPSIEGRNGEVKVKVKIMSELPQSQAIRPFDTSKGQVCALVHGQALDCGIGPTLYGGFGPLQAYKKSPDGITYLSAKDVLRWNKASEWLKNWERQHPAANISEFQPENDALSDLLYKMREYDLDLFIPWQPLVDHISDFPGNPGVWLNLDVWEDTVDFIIEQTIFLVLLIILPLVYGGIHLATWNFHFASKTEHLLWKIACVDIMGTVPIASLYYVVSYSFRRPPSHFIFFEFLLWAFYTPLSAAYALARLYIVVESFISLRHVPIGSYAAVPWVQEIPHV